MNLAHKNLQNSRIKINYYYRLLCIFFNESLISYSYLPQTFLLPLHIKIEHKFTSKFFSKFSNNRILPSIIKSLSSQ
jgi:hypothetical protein